MSDWHVIQSPTDPEMYAVQGEYLVADRLPIEDANLIAASEQLLQLARDFAAWDKRYPKCTVNPMKGERELDALFDRAHALIAKATGGAA